MSRLEQLLDEAAGPSDSPVGVREVVTRVRQRRRRRTALWGSSAACIVIAVAALGVLTLNREGDDSGARVVTSTSTDERLLIGRWIVDAMSGFDEPFAASVPWIEFGSDGSYRAFDGCNEWGGTWSVDGDELVLLSQRVEVASCAPNVIFRSRTGFRPTIQLGSSNPAVLDLVTADGSISFSRLDTLPVPSEEQLARAWKTARGDTFEFSPDGQTRVGICDGRGTWSIDGHELVISDLDRSPCPDVEIDSMLRKRMDVRVRDDTLFLSNDHSLIVAWGLRVEEPATTATTTTTTTPPETAPPTSDTELLVGRWTVGAISGVESIPPQFSLFVEFRADGTYGGSDGCAGIQGSWHVESGVLLTQPGLTSLPACPPAQGPFHARLEASPTIVYTEVADGPDTLELATSDGSISLVRSG